MDLAGFERALDEQRERSRAARGGSGKEAKAGAPAVRTRQARQVAIGQAGEAEVRRLRHDRGGHRGPRLPPGRASGRAGAQGESVLRRVGRPGERHRRRAGRRLVARGGLGAQGPEGHRGRAASSARRSSRPALHAAVDAPAPPGHRAQPQRDAPGPLRASQAARHPRAAAGLAGRSPSGCASTSPITVRSSRPPCSAIEDEVNDLVLANDVVDDPRDAVPRRAGARRDGVLLREVRRRRPGGADGPVDRALRRHPRAHHRPGRPLPLHGPDAVSPPACAGSRRSPARGALRALRELEQRLAQVAETLKAQPEHVVRRLEQLLEERQRLEARLAGGAPHRRRRGRDRATRATVGRRGSDHRRDRQRRSRRGGARSPTSSARASGTACWCSSAPAGAAPST